MTLTNANQAAISPTPVRNGFGWRVAVSVISVFALVSFFLLYAAFWASQFTGWQSVVVVIVAILAFIAANGAAWASWGVQHSSPPKA